MEAQLKQALPKGDQWLFEPKWDGFRCLAFRDGDTIQLQSKAGKPLARYFPDAVELFLSLRANRFVLDGELVIPDGDRLSFDELLLRIHPAASRIRKLAAEHPAMFIAFDLLVTERGRDCTGDLLRERRPRLEKFADRCFGASERIRLTPASEDRKDAERWFKQTHGGLDGVIAKRLDAPYLSGERTGMQKIKNIRSAECVVGGFRYGSKNTENVASLLLGLYNEQGRLDHVGFTSSLNAEQREQLTPKLESLRRKAKNTNEMGFSGQAPGGPSRWSTERSTEWQPLPPELVVEVAYDHFSGARFRHGTKFLRWRPDKPPQQCTMDQVTTLGGSSLSLLR